MQAGTNGWTINSAFQYLDKTFPDLLSCVSGKDVFDYGCGAGFHAVALAKNGARRVVGVDPYPPSLKAARALATDQKVQGSVEFLGNFDPKLQGSFDIVISLNGMEHYPDPAARIQEMLSAVKPNGKLFISFGPPWYAPYGSHMFFFTKLPWVNILFNETTVLNVRKFFREDVATRYEDVDQGLNKMTVRKFERLLADTGARVRNRKYECVRHLNFLGSIPAVRELFINNISCVLEKTK